MYSQSGQTVPFSPIFYMMAQVNFNILLHFVLIIKLNIYLNHYEKSVCACIRVARWACLPDQYQGLVLADVLRNPDPSIIGKVTIRIHL